MKNKNFTWGNIFLSILAGVIVGFGILLGVIISSKEKILEYSLSESGNTWRIEKHIDWRVNDYIPLDRSITLNEAIEAINNLNKTLIK